MLGLLQRKKVYEWAWIDGGVFSAEWLGRYMWYLEDGPGYVLVPPTEDESWMLFVGKGRDGWLLLDLYAPDVRYLPKPFVWAQELIEQLTLPKQ